jgi:hypothetical protein
MNSKFVCAKCTLWKAPKMLIAWQLTLLLSEGWERLSGIQTPTLPASEKWEGGHVLTTNFLRKFNGLKIIPTFTSWAEGSARILFTCPQSWGNEKFFCFFTFSFSQQSTLVCFLLKICFLGFPGLLAGEDLPSVWLQLPLFPFWPLSCPSGFHTPGASFHGPPARWACPRASLIIQGEVFCLKSASFSRVWSNMKMEHPSNGACVWNSELTGWPWNSHPVPPAQPTRTISSPCFCSSTHTAPKGQVSKGALFTQHLCRMGGEEQVRHTGVAFSRDQKLAVNNWDSQFWPSPPFHTGSLMIQWDL